MHERIDAYLGEIEARLKALPSSRREEELKEIKAHLGSLIAATREGGATDEDAITAATGQFGVPEDVGRGMLRAWRRERWH